MNAINICLPEVLLSAIEARAQENNWLPIHEIFETLREKYAPLPAEEINWFKLIITAKDLPDFKSCP